MADGIGQRQHSEQNSEAVELTPVVPGVWKAPGARIIDRTGRKRFAIGYADFAVAMGIGTLVDKTMLMADVLDSGYAAMLFCRPRRFGKSLNLSMMREFFEAPEAGGLSQEDAESVFYGTEIWEAKEGHYRAFQGKYPVIHLSFSTVKKLTWDDSYATIKGLMQTEYLRHHYLREEGTPLVDEDIDYFNAIVSGTADDSDYASSLAALCRMLYSYHGQGAVVLIDEYDAPVMAGHTYGYYSDVVAFLKGWLTGALKDGGASVALACLTGVQRITKESIFSDLNNLFVSTPLNTAFDERYGFTDAEVTALATYVGHQDCMPEARDWYDGYRFGSIDVYNPWSIVNYLNEDCSADIYWGNTSGNSVVGELVSQADTATLADVYALLEPGGTVKQSLDLGIVFPELGVSRSAIWSMLYLAGYLTTNDVARPNSRTFERRLRIPNREIAELYREEIIERFSVQAGGRDRLRTLHTALLAGDAPALEEELARIAEHASTFDLTSELACHMLVLGLLFGIWGYADPLSNREGGSGRYDIRLEPNTDPLIASRAAKVRPLVTVEIKFLRPSDAPKDADTLSERLHTLAQGALAQIAARAYDAELPTDATGRLRWGLAFSGKHVAAAAESLVE